ncbi:MAG TPA: hypothetical protein VGB82_22240 [Alphaproteobacteria bacterium]
MKLRQSWSHSWTVATASLGAIILLIAGAWIVLGFGSLGLDTSATIALILGIVLTVGLAVGLMGLVFYSNRSGRDDLGR